MARLLNPCHFFRAMESNSQVEICDLVLISLVEKRYENIWTINHIGWTVSAPNNFESRRSFDCLGVTTWFKCLTTKEEKKAVKAVDYFYAVLFLFQDCCVSKFEDNTPQTTTLHTAAAIPHKLHWQLVWTWLIRHKTPISANSSKAFLARCRIQRQATCYAEQRAETRCGES